MVCYTGFISGFDVTFSLDYSMLRKANDGKDRLSTSSAKDPGKRRHTYYIIDSIYTTSFCERVQRNKLTIEHLPPIKLQEYDKEYITKLEKRYASSSDVYQENSDTNSLVDGEDEEHGLTVTTKPRNKWSEGCMPSDQETNGRHAADTDEGSTDQRSRSILFNVKPSVDGLPVDVQVGNIRKIQSRLKRDLKEAKKRLSVEEQRWSYECEIFLNNFVLKHIIYPLYNHKI